MSNPFYTDPSNEVDDDEFLKHPRSGSSGYMLQNSHNTGSMSSYNQFSSSGGHRSALGLDSEGNRESGTDRVQALMEKRREIENRTLESSERSLGLLYESERAGAATAEELHRQKEQLKRTEERLDDINSTLKTSERHLQGIKSVFGGIKNYFSSRNATAAPGGNGTQSRSPNVPVASNGNVASNLSSNDPYKSNRINGYEDDIDRLDETRDQNHPGLRTRGLHENSNKSVDAVLDSNLDQMSAGLGRLKGLALNLNEELEEHNSILDRLDDKTSNADWRVKKQNKDMDKLLNPKKK